MKKLLFIVIFIYAILCGGSVHAADPIATARFYDKGVVEENMAAVCSNNPVYTNSVREGVHGWYMDVYEKNNSINFAVLNTDSDDYGKNYRLDVTYYDEKSGYFTLSVASEHTSMQTIGKFGFYSARDIDKFDGIDYITVGNGYPVIDDNTCSWMLCRVENEVDCGTHTIFIAEVTDGERLTSLTPMTYAYYHKVKGGTTAKNAPTYVEEKPQPEKEKPYKCLLCGYVFEGTAEEFEALPDDWVCPLCGAGKNLFKQEY